MIKTPLLTISPLRPSQYPSFVSVHAEDLASNELNITGVFSKSATYNGHPVYRYGEITVAELQMRVCKDFTITEKALTLSHLRHYAKLAPKHVKKMLNWKAGAKVIINVRL